MLEQDREGGRRSGSFVASHYVGYAVLDPMWQKIGRVEKLFLNGNGGAEYVRVRIGFFSARHVLIPVQGVALDRDARSVTLK